MSTRSVGERIAYYRSVARPRMTQQHLADAACVALATIRKIERVERGVSTVPLESIADALGIEPDRLAASQPLVPAAKPPSPAAIAAYALPYAGPVRPLRMVRASVEEAEAWRLAAQYTRIARTLPDLLPEALRGFHGAAGAERREWAGLLVRAARSADAAAYKVGARDLSARLIEFMRWAGPEAGDPLLEATTAYVRTETFFAARPHPPPRVVRAADRVHGVAGA